MRNKLFVVLVFGFLWMLVWSFVLGAKKLVPFSYSFCNVILYFILCISSIKAWHEGTL